MTDVAKLRSRRFERGRIAAALLASVVFLETLALGANGPLLAIAASVIEIVAAIVVILLIRPDSGLWRAGLLPFGLLAALLTVASLPGIPFLTGHVDLIRDARQSWVTPDLYPSGMTRLFGATALYFAAACAGYRRGVMRSMLGWLMMFGALDILVGLGLREFDPEHVWGLAKRIHVHRFTGTLLNANASACLFGVTALLALGQLQAAIREPAPPGDVRHGIRLGGSTLVLLAALGACAITGSRTSLALTICAILILIGLDLRRRYAGRRDLRMPVAAVAAALGMGCLFLFGDATFDRFTTVGDDGLERVTIWSHFIRIARDAPMFGYGFGSFSELNLRTLREPADAVALWYINSAHNKPIGMIIEYGWLFCLILVAIVALTGCTMNRYLRQDRVDPIPPSALAAIIVIFGCSLTDIALDVPAVSALAIILWSALWGRAARSSVDRHSLAVDNRIVASPAS